MVTHSQIVGGDTSAARTSSRYEKKSGPMQWVVAGGYLLVAIIVLVNYVGQRTDDRSKKHATTSGPVTVLDDVDVLRQQLSEERQKNKDMAGMIQRLQSSYLPEEWRRDAARAGVAPAAHRVGPDAMPSVPKLASMSVVSAPGQVSPFVPGKNPYQPFYRALLAQGRVPTTPVATPTVCFSMQPGIPSFMCAGVSGVQIITAESSETR